jgi:nicotinamide mononucleotide transporter
MKKLLSVDGIAAFFSIAGIFFNANKMIWCWPLWIIGCVCWLWYLVPKKEWTQVVLWVAFLFSNIYGWYQWSL